MSSSYDQPGGADILVPPFDEPLLKPELVPVPELPPELLVEPGEPVPLDPEPPSELASELERPPEVLAPLLPSDRERPLAASPLASLLGDPDAPPASEPAADPELPA